MVLSEYARGTNTGTSISAFLPQPVTAGDVLNVLGTPDAVLLGSNYAYLFFIGMKPVVLVSVKTNTANLANPRIQINSAISILALFDLGDCQFKSQDTFYSWRGFTTNKRYAVSKMISLIAVPQYLKRGRSSSTAMVPCRP